MKHLSSATGTISKALTYASTYFFLQLHAWTAFAQGFGGQVPAIPGTADDTAGVRPAIVNVIKFVLGFLSLVAVIFVIVGGFRILAAGGNEENVTKGRKTIIYAIIGLVVIFFARVIVGFFTQELTTAVN